MWAEVGNVDREVQDVLEMRPPDRSVDFTQVTEWEDGDLRSVQDLLAAEEPLEIRIGNVPLTVTMRTPGHDLELAAGFLLTEGIIETADQITALRQVAGENGARSNVVEVELKDTAFDAQDMQRNFFAASSCGICGKASIEAIRVRDLQPPDRDFRVDPEVLCGCRRSCAPNKRCSAGRAGCMRLRCLTPVDN